MKQLSSNEMLSVFGYVILVSLTITMVLLQELFIPFTTPKPENTSPQSTVRPSVLV
jgi:hypothetical protein